MRTLIILLLLVVSAVPAWGYEPPVLKIAAIPDENPNELLRIYTPFADYLSKELKMKVRFTPVVDYAATVEGLAAKKLDMVWYGGFTSVQAVRRLVGGSPHIDVGLGLAPMFVAATVNLVLNRFMVREARRSRSLALASEATHLQTNVVQAGAVIAGLALVGLSGERVFDPLVALALAAYMAWTAAGLVRTALSEIMDVALPEHELQAIHDVLVAHQDEIRGFHRLRSRRAGPTRHVDMHLLVDPERTVADVHTICDSIERDIQERLPGAMVIIHMEPDDGRHRGPLERLIRERTGGDSA